MSVWIIGVLAIRGIIVLMWKQAIEILNSLQINPWLIFYISLIPLLKSQIVVGFSFSNCSHIMGIALWCCKVTAGQCSGRALWPPAPGFCSQATRKSLFFHTNHNYDGHPRIYSFRALGSLQFSLEYSLRQSHYKSIFYFCMTITKWCANHWL